MRVVLQRVRSARVRVDTAVVGEVGAGYLLLVGFTHRDDGASIEWMVDKVAGLRLFNDSDGKMNLDLRAAGGAVLVVSQFTLYGNAERGRRPSFTEAAPSDVAAPLYHRFVEQLRDRGLQVETGTFGAEMEVELINDGPVTLILERET